MAELIECSTGGPATSQMILVETRASLAHNG